MADLKIRNAARGDVPVILQFITELAVFEKASDQVAATEAQIEAALFSAPVAAHAVMCEIDGQCVGFAIYFYSFSTWTGVRGLYLEDLYVTPNARGFGAGKALLRHLAQVAGRQGCERFEWSVLDWNKPAIDFYDSVGAVPQGEWIKYRLAGNALQDFAGGS